MILQMMFAVITPALISGTFAERFKFSTYLVFLVLWATLVYDPLAHWTWAIGGWIRELGALDFAGAWWYTSVPGWRHWLQPWWWARDAAMALNSWLLIISHDGGGCGAALVRLVRLQWRQCVASGSLATSAFVVTHIATLRRHCRGCCRMAAPRQTDRAGRCLGAVAGLVAITPIGLCRPFAFHCHRPGRRGVVLPGVSLKGGFGYDDSWTWWACMAWAVPGAPWLRLFASKLINEAGNNVLFFGNGAQLGTGTECGCRWHTPLW